ncbi:unnamed protein product [Closterium sp. Naga37s-1]|nr:unnamed protein product [Closterium sp. Naga37s-1]
MEGEEDSSYAIPGASLGGLPTPASKATFRLGSVFNGQEIGWDDATAARRREELREWESQGPAPVTEEQGTRGKEKDPDYRPAPGEADGASGGSGDEGWGGRGGGQAGGNGARGSGAAAKRPRASGPVGSGQRRMHSRRGQPRVVLMGQAQQGQVPPPLQLVVHLWHAATWPTIVQTPEGTPASAVTGGTAAGGSRQMNKGAFVVPRVLLRNLRGKQVLLAARVAVR